MPSNYPTSLDTFSMADITSWWSQQASTDNNYADAINKIEAELGAAPSAAYNTVADRIATGELQQYTQSTSGGVATLNMTGLSNNVLWIVTMTQSATLSITNLAQGDSTTVIVKQDATGSRIVTWPAWKWEGATPGVLSTAASAIDIFSVFHDGTNTYAMPVGYGFA